MEKVIVDVTGNIQHESANPAKIEVNRGVKGSYGWTITLAGKDPDALRSKLKEIDTALRTDYPPSEAT